MLMGGPAETANELTVVGAERIDNDLMGYEFLTPAQRSRGRSVPSDGTAC